MSSPNLSSVTEKVSSRTPVMSFSLYDSERVQEIGIGRNVQHPSQAPMQRLVNTLEIGDGDLFAENHFVETGDEESIKEAAMEDCHANDASNEFEVGEMLGVDIRGGVDLEGVAIHGGIGE